VGDLGWRCRFQEVYAIEMVEQPKKVNIIEKRYRDEGKSKKW
jgi:hypothetical protein